MTNVFENWNQENWIENRPIRFAQMDSLSICANWLNFVKDFIEFFTWYAKSHSKIYHQVMMSFWLRQALRLKIWIWEHSWVPPRIRLTLCTMELKTVCVLDLLASCLWRHWVSLLRLMRRLPDLLLYVS